MIALAAEYANISGMVGRPKQYSHVLFVRVDNAMWRAIEILRGSRPQAAYIREALRSHLIADAEPILAAEREASRRAPGPEAARSPPASRDVPGGGPMPRASPLPE